MILAQFDSLLKVGDYQSANKLLFNYLISNPTDDEVRAKYRDYSVRSDKLVKKGFNKNFTKLYSNTVRACVIAATSGWQYTRVVDKSFIDPDLELKFPIVGPGIVKLKRNPGYSPKKFKYYDGDEVFVELINTNSILKRWKLAQDLVDTHDPFLLTDSFSLISDQKLDSELTSSVSGKYLNIIILGAGVVGLALANALKMGLGDRINILVIENRVSELHIKKPYVRSWLTNVPLELFTGVYDPTVTRLLNEFGVNNYLGGKLNLIETFLYISCKKLNVKFLFSKSYDLSFVSKSRTNIIFDATGGQLDKVEQNFGNSDGATSIVLPKIKGLGERHKRHGIISRDFGEAIQIQLIKEGKFHFPVFKDKKLVTSMLKITSIPIYLYDDIIDYISQNNYDSIFYAWPGKLVSELNEILLFINLDRLNLQKFGMLIPKKITLTELMDNAIFGIKGIDARVRGLLSLIFLKSNNSDLIIIEPPFLHKPYLYLFSQSFDHIYNRPVIPVGDSLFTGNPKVSNGLENHFKIVRNIHDTFLFLYNQK